MSTSKTAEKARRFTLSLFPALTIVRICHVRFLDGTNNKKSFFAEL